MQKLESILLTLSHSYQIYVKNIKERHNLAQMLDYPASEPLLQMELQKSCVIRMQVTWLGESALK